MLAETELLFERFAVQALAFVLTYAIHSTLLLGAACILVARIARGSLRTRERLWKVALFGGLFTAAMQVGLGWRTPLAHWTIDAATVDARDSAVAAAGDSHHQAEPLAALDQLEPRESGGFELFSTEELAPTATGDTPRTPQVLYGVARGAEMLADALLVSALASSNSDTPRTSAPVASAPPLSQDSDASPAVLAALRDWRAWLTRGLALWAGFAALVLALFASMWLALERRLRGGRELVEGELKAMLEALSPRRVRLFVAPRLRTPVSFGWWRGTICVPPRALTELSSDEQESMLAHELAHLERRDPLWLSLAWFVERVFFFQPLNRVARAQLIDLAELLCDDSAARRTGKRIALASCLARIASWIVGRERSLPATSMAEGHGRSRLCQRIERLLDESIAHEAGERRRTFLAVAGLGLASAVLVAPGVAAASFEAVLDVPRSNELELAGGDFWEQPCEVANELQESLDQDALEGRQDSLLETPAAPAVAQPPAQTATLGRSSLSTDLAGLDSAVQALAAEIVELRTTLIELDLGEDLEHFVDELEQRAARLSSRRERLARLLEPTLYSAHQPDSSHQSTSSHRSMPSSVLGAAATDSIAHNVR